VKQGGESEVRLVSGAEGQPLVRDNIPQSPIPEWVPDLDKKHKNWGKDAESDLDSGEDTLVLSS